MATSSSSSFPEVHLPVRSISLPSRIHPTSVKLESALTHLKNTYQTPSFSTNETIQNSLVSLTELYNLVEEHIQSPQTQQSLLKHNQNRKLIEEALDASVTLLDTCDTARGLLLTMKDHVQSLQSALRRRGGIGNNNSSIESEVSAYVTFRKKMKKEIAKSVSALKKMENKVCPSLVLDNFHLSSTIKVIQETRGITILIFRAVLLFLSMPTMKSGKKTTGWSLISKLMPVKVEKIIDEVESFNVSIDGIEGGLGSMFRCLVQNRVSLLNILTH